MRAPVSACRFRRPSPSSMAAASPSIQKRARERASPSSFPFMTPISTRTPGGVIDRREGHNASGSDFGGDHEQGPHHRKRGADRAHRRGDRRPCHHPARHGGRPGPLLVIDLPRNRHAAQGRHPERRDARPRLGTELAHAVACPERPGAQDHRGRVHRRIAEGRTGPAESLPARHFELSLARQRRFPGKQGGALQGLCLRYRHRHPHRPHPAGRLDPGHGQDRRAARQAFRRARHNRHRQVLLGGADPEAHPREESASPHRAARRPSRI